MDSENSSNAGGSAQTPSLQFTIGGDLRQKQESNVSSKNFTDPKQIYHRLSHDYSDKFGENLLKKS